MGSLPFPRKKKRCLMASLLFGAGYGNRFALSFPSRGKDNRCRHQCLHWCRQPATGRLHINRFNSLPNVQIKKRCISTSFLFGAGYGNRTRLRGLGSHYNSRYTNPAMCGYYSKWKRKIQPLFVDTKMRGQVSCLPPVLIKPLPESDAWVWHRWTAPRFCLLSLPSAWERS